MFLGPAWLYCDSAWGWLLAKCGGKSGVLVFACWLNLGVFNPFFSRDTWLVFRFSSWGRSLCSHLFIFRSCEGSAQKLSLWFPSAGTKQWQQGPVWPSFSAGKGEQWLWFKPFRAGMGPGLSPLGWSKSWGLIKKSRSLLCFIVCEFLENSAGLESACGLGWMRASEHGVGAEPFLCPDLSSVPHQLGGALCPQGSTGIKDWQKLAKSIDINPN